MRNLLTLTLAVAVLTLSGCANQQEQLMAWANQHDGQARVIHTPQFDLQVVSPRTLKSADTLTIYIEGDGHAWATSSQPSLDPSPQLRSTPALALSQAHPGIYLARPCQFVQGPNCSNKMWTDARFSTAAVQATQSAIDTLKEQYKAHSIELIGYSGGAAIALLVAEGRSDVMQIQTISGNVDPVAWVHLNNLTPLKDSVDPLQSASRLQKIPQRHFVGDRDMVIPAILTHEFVEKISASCAEVVIIHGDHQSIINKISGKDLNVSLKCKR